MSEFVVIYVNNLGWFSFVYDWSLRHAARVRWFKARLVISLEASAAGAKKRLPRRAEVETSVCTLLITDFLNYLLMKDPL